MNKFIRNIHEVIKALEARSDAIKSMNLTSSIADFVIDPATNPEMFDFANTPGELDAMASSVTLLLEQGLFKQNDAERALKDLLSTKTFYGHYCELRTYGWLLKRGAKFQPNIVLTNTDILNSSDSTIDGYFSYAETYFDIKGMGFLDFARERFRAKLERMLPGHRVIINSTSEVAVKDIEIHAFGNLTKVVEQLSTVGHYQFEAPIHWHLKTAPRTTPVTIELHTIDQYQIAEQNRFYPFKGASQFTKNQPFFLIFSWSNIINKSLSQNVFNSNPVLLRALARRIFLQHMNDTTPVKSFDTRVTDNTSLGEASRLLSGLFFLDLHNDTGYFFLNPNAKHKATRQTIELMFDGDPMQGFGIDGFYYDNY